MRKLGLIGRWREFPASGMTLEGTGVREVEIRFNTMERTVIYVEEPETLEKVVQGDQERGEGTTHRKVPRPGSRTLLGVLDGLESFNFRAQLPCRLRVEQAEGSSVFYDTEVGKNYTIDGEHLEDFTVPMIGRRERNEELDAMRYEMRQQMREQSQMFAEFMAFQRAAMTKSVQEEKPDGKSNETDKPAKPEPGKPETGADSGAGGDVRPSPEKRPERTVPSHGEVQGATAKGDQGGSAS